MNLFVPAVKVDFKYSAKAVKNCEHLSKFVKEKINPGNILAQFVDELFELHETVPYLFKSILQLMFSIQWIHIHLQ